MSNRWHAASPPMSRPYVGGALDDADGALGDETGFLKNENLVGYLKLSRYTFGGTDATPYLETMVPQIRLQRHLLRPLLPSSAARTPQPGGRCAGGNTSVAAIDRYIS